jgi:hypothetical protein
MAEVLCPHNRHGHPIGHPCAGEIACSRALQIMEDSVLRNPGISADAFPCFIETPHPLDFPVACTVKNPGHLVKTYGFPGAMMSASSPTKARDISLTESRLSASVLCYTPRKIGLRKGMKMIQNTARNDLQALVPVFAAADDGLTWWVDQYFALAVTTSPASQQVVAYLRAADNVSRLLPIWLRGVNQLVIRSRNLFSSPHLTRLAYI